MNIKPKSRQANIVIQELEKEVLIYDLKINKVYCLNETSALVWQFCDGQKSITEISCLVGNKLNSSSSEELVWLTLDQLKRTDLLETSTELETKFNGLSRREVVKKIGYTSLVALPLITSIVAPTAVQAQSGCSGSGQSCGGGVACCPGFTCDIEGGCIACASVNQSCIGIRCCPGSFCDIERGCIACVPQGQSCSLTGLACCPGLTCDIEAGICL